MHILASDFILSKYDDVVWVGVGGPRVCEIGRAHV